MQTLKVYELIRILETCDQKSPVVIDVRTSDEERIVFSVDYIREYGGVVAIESREEE